MYFRSQRKLSQEVSLSEPLDGESDGDTLSLMDILRCDDDLLERVELSDRQQQLRRYMQQVLDCRECEVLRLRYGLCGQPPMAQREVADHCGISRSYVSRIEKKALLKLADCFQGDHS